MSDEIEHLVGPDQVRLLLAIAEAGSFSGAAAALGISQPAISQQVKRLETRTGRVLFQRIRTGVSLTPDGEAVVIYARAMVALGDDLRRHFRDTAARVRLEIGMPEVFCRTALPKVLWLFMRDHPNVQLRIVCGNEETLAAALEARTLDFAVMRRRHPSLVGLPTLWRDQLVWIGRADLTLPIRDPVPLVVPLHPNGLRQTLTETLSAQGRSWDIPFESPSLATLEAALQVGLGVCATLRSMPIYGLVPLGAASGLPDLPEVEFVMVEHDPPTSEAARAFCDVIRQAAVLSFPTVTPVAG